MIDVDTYRRLPDSDRAAIDEWLAALGPRVTEIPRYTTEVELIGETGTWRIRHERLDRHGRILIEGDEPQTTDSFLDVADAPEVLMALGPGGTPPPEPFIDRRWS